MGVNFEIFQNFVSLHLVKGIFHLFDISLSLLAFRTGHQILELILVLRFFFLLEVSVLLILFLVTVRRRILDAHLVLLGLGKFVLDAIDDIGNLETLAGILQLLRFVTEIVSHFAPYLAHRLGLAKKSTLRVDKILL